MNSNDYFKKQEEQKKLFELSDEAQKKAILNEMRAAEGQFINENFAQRDSHVDVKTDDNDIQVEPKKKTLGYISKEVGSIVSIHTEKITPDNLFDKCKFTDSNGNDASKKLEEYLKNNPDCIKKICDLSNIKSRSNMIGTLGNTDGFTYFDDGKNIGFKKEGAILDPKSEVQGILDRAQKFKAIEREKTNKIELMPLKNTNTAHNIKDAVESLLTSDSSAKENTIKTDNNISETNSFKL